MAKFPLFAPLRFGKALLAGFSVVPAAYAAQHGSDGGQFAVSASVASACDIGGGPSGALAPALLDFGQHADFDRPGSPSLDMTTALRIDCTVGVSPMIRFDNGENARGEQRDLRGPGDALIPYDLLQGSASAPRWDDKFHPLPLVSGQDKALLIYARVPALPADAPDGVYTDEVRITLSY